MKKFCAAGFEIIPEVVSSQQIDAFLAVLPKIPSAGLRQPHTTFDLVSEIANSPMIRDLIANRLSRGGTLVRSTLFDKTPESNWAVPWHQDLTIAVRERRDVPGFIGWSVKDGVHHVQAPREILENMLTVRLHLDDCGLDSGPLRVLPGTHTNGWLEAGSIDSAKTVIAEEICVVGRDGALLMKPLLLHASSRATVPNHRRVLHLEFAAVALPGGLQFAA